MERLESNSNHVQGFIDAACLSPFVSYKQHMVIFSRFQTELFAYSPLSTMSYSVVDSFNLLNAIFAFCSSRGSGLVLTQSPQQITAQPHSSRGGGSGTPGPQEGGKGPGTSSPLQNRPLLAVRQRGGHGPPLPLGQSPGAAAAQGCLRSRVRVGAVWGHFGWQSLAFVTGQAGDT